MLPTVAPSLQSAATAAVDAAVAETSRASRSNSNSNRRDDNAPLEPACSTCKKRRIICDRSLPTCLKCAKKGLPCPGYSKPKIIWKVLKLHAVESREWQRVDDSHGKSRVGGSGSSRRTRTSRTGKKGSMLDIGYTFKVEFNNSPAPPHPTSEASTPPTAQSSLRTLGSDSISSGSFCSGSVNPHACNDAAGNSSEQRAEEDEDEDVETIERVIDPYHSSLDYYSRDVLKYYEARICLSLEYLKPIGYLRSLAIEPPSSCSYNPLKILISEASQCPILLNGLLAVSTRHRAILLARSGSGVGRPDPYGARKARVKALNYYTQAVTLLRKRVEETKSPQVVELNDGEDAQHSGPLQQDEEIIRREKLWKDGDSLVILLMMMYYEMIDGGTAEGSWRRHLEFAKWVIEMRDMVGLEMHTKTRIDVSFIRSHMEVFDAVGSSFVNGSRLYPTHLWLQAEPRKEHNGRHGYPSPTVTSLSESPFIQQALPFKDLQSTINDPDPVNPFGLLWIPTPLLKIIHHITDFRRLYAQAPPTDHPTQAYKYLLGALHAFDPQLWSDTRQALPIRFTPNGPPCPPSQNPINPIEEVALARAYHLSCLIYLHMALVPPNYPPNKFHILETLTTDLIEALRLVSLEGIICRSMVWPCMVACIGAQTMQQVVFLRRYARYLQTGMPCQGVARGFEAVEKLWTRRIKKCRRDDQTLEDVYIFAEETQTWEDAIGWFEGDWLVI